MYAAPPARLLNLVNSIRDQAATFREITERIDSWQIKLASQRNDKVASKSGDWTGCHNNTAVWLSRERREGWLDFTGVACDSRCYCDPY